MKYLLASIIVVAVVIMPGCMKEKKYTTFMKAYIQGISFYAIDDQAQLVQEGSAAATRWYISGSTQAATIRLILDDVSLGEHPLSLGRATLQRGGFTSYSHSGSLTITSVKPYINGWFSFITNDSTSVSAGAFSVYNK